MGVPGFSFPGFPIIEQRRSAVRRLSIYLLLLVVLLLISINAFLWIEESHYNPWGQGAIENAWSRIISTYSDPDGTFRYEHYEAILIRELDLIKQGTDPHMDLLDLFYHIDFLKTRNTGEITNLIPVLSEHTSTSLGFGWNENSGLWPCRVSTEAWISIGAVCSDVLKHHGLFRAPDKGQE